MAALLLNGLLVLCISKPLRAQGTLGPEFISSVIDTSLDAFEKWYVNPEVIPRIARFVHQKMAKGLYLQHENTAELTQQLRKDFREVTHDRHIWIDVMENRLITDRDVPLSEIILEKRAVNFGVKAFEFFDGRVAYLRLDSFMDTTYALETVAHAMGLLINGESVILDLRENHGGHSNMCHFICSHFFHEKRPLNALYFRAADSLVQAWTNPDLAGPHILDQSVYILTSASTASAAESFAYYMKHSGRAVIIGEKTRGAAYWKETFPFPHLGIFLEIPVARPINPFTKKDWEGEGVIPHIQVPREKALDKALELARRDTPSQLSPSNR